VLTPRARKSSVGTKKHPQWALLDVYAATIPSFPFEPGAHTMLRMPDGLPELKDFPKQLGTSGPTLPE
jgi:hypothetical protein